VTTAPTITLDTSLGNTEDWVFTLNNNAGTDSPSASTVYAQAWLLRTQRLHWAQSSNGGGVEANLEFGAIFLRSGSQAYLDADPFITESPTSATTPPYLLRLPSLTPGSTGSLAGSGTHSVAFRLTSSDVLAQIPTTSGGQAVTRLRLDVQGTLADIWCSSLVLRNNFQTLPTGYSYAADTTTWPCSQTAAQLAASSGVRSLVYDSSSATATVPFQLTHGNLAASLQV
jgi:hypothetical protein